MNIYRMIQESLEKVIRLIPRVSFYSKLRERGGRGVKTVPAMQVILLISFIQENIGRCISKNNTSKYACTN